jgi:hypothetical protein
VIKTKVLAVFVSDSRHRGGKYFALSPCLARLHRVRAKYFQPLHLESETKMAEILVQIARYVFTEA